MEYEAKPNSPRNYNALPHGILMCLCDYIDAHLESPLTLEELGVLSNTAPFTWRAASARLPARPSTST